MTDQLTDSGPDERSLLEALRTCTKPLHLKAERTGIVRDMLRGNASRFGYALLLRNLLPAYQQLEHELERVPTMIAPIIISARALRRCSAIRLDLEALYGTNWQTRLPLLDSGKSYGDQILSAARKNRKLLLAHAYVRYLGDLNGGQILRRMLLKMQVPSAALNFYMFPYIGDMEQFKADYVDALATAAIDKHDVEAITGEAIRAFNLNIELFREVKCFADTN